MRISDWSSDVCSSDRIERYFAPLAAKADGTFGLHNDAAVLPVGPGERLVATVDTMIAGRHFLDCPPDLVARTRLRVILPDLATESNSVGEGQRVAVSVQLGGRRYTQ